MLNCIWHKIKGMSVVETDEYYELMTTGDYFDNPLLKKEEVKHEKNVKSRKRTGHDLQSKNDSNEGNWPRVDERSNELQCGNDEYRPESARTCTETDKGDRIRVSSEIKGKINVTSSEDNK